MRDALQEAASEALRRGGAARGGRRGAGGRRRIPARGSQRDIALDVAVLLAAASLLRDLVHATGGAGAPPDEHERHATSTPSPPAREQVARLERRVGLGLSSDADAERHLRPLLREVAGELLASRGLDASALDGRSAGLLAPREAIPSRDAPGVSAPTSRRS